MSHGEQMLWAAVIAQAIRDATTELIHGERPSKSAHTRAECQRWLLRPNANFTEACQLAGLCERQTRETARREIEAFEAARAAGDTSKRGRKNYRHFERAHAH